METNQLAVKQAIYSMGGATLASFKLGVSSSSIHKWSKRGAIPRLDKAQRVAEESGIDINLLRPRFKG